MWARDFLFDFDGTLVDSTALHDWSFREVLAAAAPERLIGFAYSTIQGLTTAEAFRRLGIGEPDRLAHCVALKHEVYRAAVRDGCLREYPGTRSLLETVTAGGGECYLVTSGSRGSVRLALAACGLERYFTGVITADDAPAGKPAPAPYLACLCRFGIERRGAIAIEDAGSGIASAHAAGLRVIGVHNPAIARSADFYFDSLAALRGAIEHRGENDRPS